MYNETQLCKSGCTKEVSITEKLNEILDRSMEILERTRGINGRLKSVPPVEQLQ